MKNEKHSKKQYFALKTNTKISGIFLFDYIIKFTFFNPKH